MWESCISNSQIPCFMVQQERNETILKCSRGSCMTLSLVRVLAGQAKAKNPDEEATQKRISNGREGSPNGGRSGMETLVIVIKNLRSKAKDGIEWQAAIWEIKS
ncbi:hypothetical protein C0J52_08245 [Blattella germanica]|nr:hypothetical protein C0J52_08245 [Blattella germanica]